MAGRRESKQRRTKDDMRATPHRPKTAVVKPRNGRTKGSQPGLQRRRLDGPKSSQTRAQQKTGGYKRVEIFLGMEATIALRQLMRDGRSAREVIETMLLTEKQRRTE